MKISLFAPTLEGKELWPLLINSINTQTINIEKKLIIDSGSKDDTVKIASDNGFEIIQIDKKEFNHGGTRNQAIEILKEHDIIVFLTQDVILANEIAIEELIKPFSDPKVACVYGRQLPHENANPLAKHAREYSYPDKSITKDLSTVRELGFRVSHISNAFAAYRTSIFKEIGTFPTDVIIAEDTFLASKIIKAGLKIVYASDAKVYHSHNYSPIEEFKRYFDTGVFHKQNAWIRADFGQPEGAGLNYLKKEMTFLIKKHPLWLIPAIFSNGMKWLGFKLGQNYLFLPKIFLKMLSMHKNYWKV